MSRRNRHNYKYANENGLLHPVFDKCALLETDEYWKGIFKDLSVGKSPTLLYIVNNTILYRGKTSLSYSFADKSAEIIGTELKELLLKHTNISSLQDKLNKQILIEEGEKRSNSAISSKWSSIRKKVEKELHLLNYVVKLQREHNLSTDSAKSLLDTIKGMMLMKQISPKDVHMENGKITHIEGFNVEYNKNIFLSDELASKETNSLEKDNKRSLADRWGKFYICLMQITEQKKEHHTDLIL